jgi:hypothetical protein
MTAENISPQVQCHLLTEHQYTHHKPQVVMAVLNFIGHVSHCSNDANQQSRWLSAAFVSGNTNISELKSSF